MGKSEPASPTRWMAIERGIADSTQRAVSGINVVRLRWRATTARSAQHVCRRASLTTPVTYTSAGFAAGDRFNAFKGLVKFAGIGSLGEGSESLTPE